MKIENIARLAEVGVKNISFFSAVCLSSSGIVQLVASALFMKKHIIPIPSE